MPSFNTRLAHGASLTVLMAALALLPSAGQAADRPATAAPAAAADAGYSATEVALFMTDHLKALPPQGARLRYHFRKSGPFEAGYEDNVLLEVGKPDPATDNGRSTKLDFLTGAHHTDLPPVEGAKGNPVILGFLERDLREMKRLTGGQPNYYRKRLRLAMVDAKDVKPVKARWMGHEVAAQEIVLDPYKDDPARARFARFANKTYRFVLSDQVPGQVLEIQTVMHEGSLSGAPMIEETLTLMETP